MDAPIRAVEDAPGLGWFLKCLAEQGRAIVSDKPLPNADADATSALRQLHQIAQAELGLEVPPFSMEAAVWGARLFYHLCQFTVCRDIGEEQIRKECGIPCPAPRGPEADWSADLTLRHLPKAFALARHLSHADPLVLELKRIAAAWPLSSVGIPGLEKTCPDSFIDHPALRRLYADRILTRGDASRLGDARVDECLRSDLGAHRDLAPGLAAKLFQDT